jgi:membrane peptidoglycan carboxypeptidase
VFTFWESKTSSIQARVAVWFTRQLGYTVEKGPSSAILFPKTGPYDIRLGYALMPELIERLKAADYALTAQAHLSPLHYRLIGEGLFPIYREKTQAGVVIDDANDKPLYSLQFPVLSYQTFEDIPRPVVDTLLFIENRKLLDVRYPHRNPAVELSRLARAVAEQVESKLGRPRKTAGGSTLATQIEKFRHSAEGRTSAASDKLRQMSAATLRAYLDGDDTREVRKRIVLEFINSVPLGAIPGQGQVLGLSNSLKAWYGVDGAKADKLLRLGSRPVRGAKRLREQATAYKQVLSLFLAQRRPTYYLQTGLEALNRLANVYVALLAKENIVSPAFRDAVLAVKLKFTTNHQPVQPEKKQYLERKAANSVRIHLLRLFGMQHLYELDRLDLRVKSTFDFAVQKEVTDFLSRLRDDKVAGKLGLKESRMLDRGSAADAIFSFTLLERAGDANVVRVQTDNLEGPFNVNESGKLELGSTAKLRTLVTYLEVIAELHARYAALDPAALAQERVEPSDRLAQWALAFYRAAPDKSLRPMLEAAMQRRYAASTKERFFTGGGVHKFANFDKEDDAGFWTVAESLQKSINLPFVRLMRDVVQHFVARQPGFDRMLRDAHDPRRREYLERFAHKEGRFFLARFYNKYRGLTPEKAFDLLASTARGWPRRYAAAFRSVYPRAAREEFTAQARLRFGSNVISTAGLQRLYDAFAPEKSSLVDRAYTAHMHPLELWLVGYLQDQTRPPTLASAIAASGAERLAVYQWLFDLRDRERQNTRLQVILEEEAFAEVHKRWQRLGFPFGALVPSYATALGSSGDRPLALAELIGIIINDGVRYPALRIRELHFGAGTPYETLLTRTPPPPERVLDPEIARVVKAALVDVATKGTAQRVKGAFTLPDGTPLVVGGKTGTGDNRFQAFGPGGKTISSKVMSRTATFVFFIGDRFFGTIVVHIPGAAAAQY